MSNIHPLTTPGNEETVRKMQYTREITADYLVRYHNAYKANEACNGILIKRGIQEHGIKILFPLHTTGFYSLQENEKKEADTT